MKITRYICNDLAQHIDMELIRHGIGDDVHIEQLLGWIQQYFYMKLEKKYMDPIK